MYGLPPLFLSHEREFEWQLCLAGSFPLFPLFLFLWCHNIWHIQKLFQQVETMDDPNLQPVEIFEYIELSTGGYDAVWQSKLTTCTTNAYNQKFRRERKIPDVQWVAILERIQNLDNPSRHPSKPTKCCLQSTKQSKFRRSRNIHNSEWIQNLDNPDILHNLPNAVLYQQNNPNLGDQGIFTIPNESRIWIIQTPFKTYQDLENSVVLASTKCWT